MLTFKRYCQLMGEIGILRAEINMQAFYAARRRYALLYHLNRIRPNSNTAQAKPCPQMRRDYTNRPGTFTGRKHTAETKALISHANKIKARGAGNSQWGTLWITDGKADKKIKRNQTIPEGWRKGRMYWAARAGVEPATLRLTGERSAN